MQTSLLRFTVPGGAGVYQSAEVVEQLKKDETTRLSLRWRRTLKGPGRPSRQVLWNSLLYDSIERAAWHGVAHLPNGQVPKWWKE
eukprot:1678972-Amphidinium_carterae.1